MMLTPISQAVKPALNVRAGAKEQLVSAMAMYLKEGDSLAAACERLIAEITSHPANALALAGRLVTRNGAIPSVSTLRRCYQTMITLGPAALAGNYKGRIRKDYGWEARAIELYSLPSKPAMLAVSLELIDEGHTTATASRVRRFLNALPAQMGKNSPARMGKLKYKDSQRLFVRRDTSVLNAGDIYQGDGHTIDVYLAHPNGRRVWRPELTVWLDVASRYIVGWYMSENESSMSTLCALSYAIVKQNHIPAMLHIDNGSGFKSKMMADESTGYYSRFGISTMFSLPRNAKGKGQVERWFKTMEQQYGKFCPNYCGADMAPEALDRITTEVEAGRRKLMTLAEYASGLDKYIKRYNNQPHGGLDKKTPADIWATLEPSGIEETPEIIVRPRVTRAIRRSVVRLDNREYGSHELAQFNGKNAQVEYDLHDDSTVRLLDKKGRWLCDAPLIRRKAYIDPSRIEQAKKNRLASQTKRLENKIDEAERRAKGAIEHDKHILEIEAGNALASKLINVPNPARLGTDESLSDIDIFSLDY